MKKNIILSLFLVSTSSFAITEDIFILQDELNNIVQEEFENINLNSTIYVNQKNRAVLELKKHLNTMHEGGLFTEYEINTTYDKKLSDYVKEFQAANLLNPTGFLDPITWKNIYPRSSTWRAQSIASAINSLEDIKLQHSTHSNNQMMVIHIPSMTLKIYQRNESLEYEEVFQSNTVIGKSSTKTPLTSFEITSIKYNPDWTPTPNILRRGAFKNNSINEDWLKKHNITVRDANGAKVNYNEIDINSKFNYRYVQPPSANNALGVLKFETTSKENIYLHDTNEKNLFQHNSRAYSSGCVRVEKPFELASFLVQEDISSIQSKVDTKRTFFQKLPQNLPVYFDYSLAKVNANQEVLFYNDIYKRF